MDSKYIVIFVMSLVIGSGFVVFINSDTEFEATTVPETTTTTTVPETTTTTTTTTTVPETTTTTTVPETTTTTVPETTTTTTVPETTTTTVPETTTTTTTTVPETTTTTTTVPETTEEDTESVLIASDSEETPDAYTGPYLNFAGFEGSNQSLLEELVLSMPQLLQDLLSNKVIFVNGCHKYAESLVGRCPYGVWDSSGTNSDGSKGADWSMSIWVSNRAFEANQAEDVLIHESSHALSFITRNCNTSENTSYRLDAWDYFGGEEKFADALVLYFGGSYNHYRDSGSLSNEETIYLDNFLQACTSF